MPLLFVLLPAALGAAMLQRSRRRSLRPVLLVALAASPLLLGLYAYLAPLPSPDLSRQPAGAVVLDANGVVLQRDMRQGLRIPVALDEVSPAVIDATIAAEDGHFRLHPGVDPLAAARAILRLPWQRSGASTITQQVARMLYLPDDGSPLLLRKAREALIALQLEARYSKDAILTLYLNNAYYGRGAYGIEAAARVYFGVSARNLDLAQAAMLAGLPQGPAALGADLDAAASRARQSYVIGRMLSAGKASLQDAAAVLAEPLSLAASGNAPAPHFVQYALDELRHVAPELAEREDIVIETTLDASLQQEAARQLRYQLDRLRDRDVGNGAVVVLEPAGGRILAMLGSAGFWDESIDGQVNMALAPRQPGSALKPFLYAAALEQGFTAASPLLDVPTTFQTPAGPYTPLDFDRRFRGPVSLRTALASSLNVPAVRTLDQVGIDAFLSTAHRFGLSTLTDAEVYGLALTLGGGEVRLLDLTAAYGALAAGGLLSRPYAVERVRDADGNVLYEHRPAQPARVLTPEHAFLISDILSDPLARRAGFGDAPVLSLPYRAAVKTGTTSEFRDNWTLGYTPERVVGVWAGNTDNRPMRDVSGVDGAGPVWRGVMEAALEDLPPSWPQPPSALLRTTVCNPTGLRPGPDCPSATDDWFVAGSEPRAVETYYSRDGAGRLVIDPPVEARAWALDAGLSLLGGPSPRLEGPFVVQPAQGSVLLFAPELPRQTALLRASPPPGARRLEFRLDSTLIGSAAPELPELVWNLEPGRHVLEVTALLQDGRRLSAFSNFEVRQ